MQQARLAHAWLADYGDYLTTAISRHLKRASDLFDFLLTPDKLRKSTLDRNLKMALQRAWTCHFVDVDGSAQTFDRQCSQRLQLEIAFDQHARLIAHRNRAGRRDYLQPRSEIRSMTDGSVFGVPASADFTQHHFTRVHTHTGRD
jgi:hypothetical protein